MCYRIRVKKVMEHCIVSGKMNDAEKETLSLMCYILGLLLLVTSIYDSWQITGLDNEIESQYEDLRIGRENYMQAVQTRAWVDILTNQKLLLEREGVKGSEMEEVETEMERYMRGSLFNLIMWQTGEIPARSVVDPWYDYSFDELYSEWEQEKEKVLNEFESSYTHTQVKKLEENENTRRTIRTNITYLQIFGTLLTGVAYLLKEGKNVS